MDLSDEKMSLDMELKDRLDINRELLKELIAPSPFLLRYYKNLAKAEKKWYERPWYKRLYGKDKFIKEYVDKLDVDIEHYLRVPFLLYNQVKGDSNV